MATTINLFDAYVVELRGNGKSVNKLRKTFDRFVAEDVDRDPDLVCEFTETAPDPEMVFGAPDEYYGREGDRFVIKKPDGFGFMSIRYDWEHIHVSAEIDHYLVAYLIEYEVRKRLASEGYAMIHASGVRLDDTVLLFPSWRYTGKTNTLMTLLESGADYLSDDRLWVGADGTVLGYPVPINMMPSNIESYPGIAGRDRKEKLRADLTEEVYDRIDRDRSVLDKMVYFATKIYLEPDQDRRLVSIEQLVPGADFVERSTVDNVVALRTALDTPNNRVEVNEVSEREVLADARTINDYEWNGRLKEYFAAYDALFPGDERADELDSLIAREEENFLNLLGDIGTYRAMIPRERDWQSTGIADDLVSKFRRLETPTVIQP